MNLANIFERGNRKLGIEQNQELHQKFKMKAYYHTNEGIVENSLSPPKAGETF